MEGLRDSSPHVILIVTRMLEKFEEIFGSGVEGTVAAADPRTKGGVGIPNADQHFI